MYHSICADIVTYKLYFVYFLTFLYEIMMCAGANNMDEITNRTDLLITPLNKNTTDGITDNANALKTVSFLK